MTRPSPGPHDPAWTHRTAPGVDGDPVHYGPKDIGAMLWPSMTPRATHIRTAVG
jgi:hypothetical protein